MMKILICPGHLLGEWFQVITRLAYNDPTSVQFKQGEIISIVLSRSALTWRGIIKIIWAAVNDFSQCFLTLGCVETDDSLCFLEIKF